MGLRLMRKAKTLFLTFGVVSLGMYVLLNTLASEMSLKNVKLSDIEIDKIQLLPLQKPVKHEAFQDVFAAQGQRKQKTLLNNEYNPVGDNYAYEQNENNEGENLISNLKHESDVVNFEHKSNQLHLDTKDKFEHGEEMLNDKDKFDDDDNDLDDDDKDDLYDPNEEDEEYVYDGHDSEENNVGEKVDNYHYDDTTNAPFQPGDFGDVAGKEYYRKPKLKFAEVKDTNHGVNGVAVMSMNEDDNDVSKKELVENGIFWSQYVENLIPKGKSYSEVTREISELRKQVVKTLDQPDWDRCGRPMNGYAVLSDDTKLCVRYRQPHSTFIYGEALSFYLSRLLKMDNVPTVILANTNSTSEQWRNVDIKSLTWEEDKMVALIAWVDEINSGASSKAYIPPLLLQAYRTGNPVTRQVIQASQDTLKDKSSKISIVQWGTMIVFDYLTGNYDRVASMQDAESREDDQHIIEESIRNLKKSASTDKLWLIDNECGLLDAYRLLKPYSSNTRFTTFHKQMLQTMCVFELPFVQALRKLFHQPSPHKRLFNFAISFEPYLKYLPNDKLFENFSELFDKRLAEVMAWIEQCELWSKE